LFVLLNFRTKKGAALVPNSVRPYGRLGRIRTLTSFRSRHFRYRVSTVSPLAPTKKYPEEAILCVVTGRGLASPASPPRLDLEYSLVTPKHKLNFVVLFTLVRTRSENCTTRNYIFSFWRYYKQCSSKNGGTFGSGTLEPSYQ
jgi:hypothetical protein